jgi:outer membrane murein-binding lipoprotein Lpp
MNILKTNCNLVVIGFILFFIFIIVFSLLSSDIETMSLSETANADSAKTDMLAARVDTLTPMVDKMSTDVGNNTTGIKTNTDIITTVLKQKVNDVNKKVGKDITDKSNTPAPITGTS